MREFFVRLEGGVLSVWGVPKNIVNDKAVNAAVVRIVESVAGVQPKGDDGEDVRGSHGEIIVACGSKNHLRVHAALKQKLHERFENEETRDEKLPRFKIKGKARVDPIGQRASEPDSGNGVLHRPRLRTGSSTEEPVEAGCQPIQ